jgi:CRISPR-associated endonuclease/helicase Cas3
MIEGSKIFRDKVNLNMFHREYIAHRRESNGEIQNLSLHLKEVSKKAGEFASKIGLKECGEIIGLLHDIGKTSEEFEQYIKSATGLINSDEDDYVDAAERRGKVDHSTSGAQIIFKELFNKGGKMAFVAQVLSLCVASHHSGLIDCIAPDGVNSYLKRMNKADKKTHLEEVTEKLDSTIKKYIKEVLQSQELHLNCISAFKKLKSNHDSKETLTFKYNLLVRFIFSCLIDADRLSTADFEHPRLAKLRTHSSHKNWSVLTNRLEGSLKNFKSAGINIVRQRISKECADFSSMPKGLYQLAVPTGGGKTFASLRFALHHADKYAMDRIVYILPFTTIIDQNADEIKKVLQSGKNSQDRIVLEHHSNLTPEKETAWQKVLSENWDAPVVLTTSVQILEALFGSGTRGARRMHQLANAVIVFDEVQAMPIKCIHMFNTAINFLVNNCGSTVVLCTATQPLLDRIEPKSRALMVTGRQQIVPNSRQLFVDLKRIEIFDKRKAGGWTNVDVKELVEKSLKEMGSVLIVVNTKKTAQQVYVQCKQIKDVEVYHLSAYMCPVHRLEILNKVTKLLEKNKPVICVSTQLIEAGVDISFGSVIRFLAGLDSIAQAAGRCNRHNELAPTLGKVVIINSAEENIDKLEDIRIGQEKTARILDEFKADPERFKKDSLGPEAMEQYYQYYFFQRKDKMNYPVNAKSAVGRDDNLFNLFSMNMVSVEEYKRISKKAPEIPLKQAFMTAAESFQAIETASRGIVVPYGKEGKELVNKLCSVQEIDKQYKLIHRAQRYSVSLFPDKLEKLQRSGAVHEAQEGSGILYLEEQYYSDEFGLSLTLVKEADFLGS